MLKYIKRVQSKNEGDRKKVLIIWMSVSMVLVLSVWVCGFTDKFGPKTVAKASEDIKPFKLFANSMSQTYQNISASVGNIPSLSNTKKTEEKVIDLIPVESKN